MQNMLKWVAVVFFLGLVASDTLDWGWIPDWMPGSILFLIVLLIAALILGAVTGRLADIARQLGEAAEEQPIKGILLFAMFTGIYVSIVGTAFFWGIPFLQEQTLLPYRWTWMLGIVLSLFAIPPLVLAYKMVGIPWEEKILRRATQSLAILVIVSFAIVVFENPTRGFSIDGNPLYMVAEKEGRIYSIPPKNCSDQNPCYSPATREKLRPAMPADVEKYGTNPRIMQIINGAFSAFTSSDGWMAIKEGVTLWWGLVILGLVFLMIFFVKKPGTAITFSVIAIIGGALFVLYTWVMPTPAEMNAAAERNRAAAGVSTQRVAPQSTWKYYEVVNGTWKSTRVISRDTDSQEISVLYQGNGDPVQLRGVITEDSCGKGRWRYKDVRSDRYIGSFTFCISADGSISGETWNDTGSVPVQFKVKKS